MNDNTIRDIVNDVLKDNQKARDDDFLLCALVYARMGYAKRSPLGITIYYKNIDFAPAFETITRIRREIQNTEHRYEASDEVKMKRWKHEISLRDYYKSKPMNINNVPNSWMLP